MLLSSFPSHPSIYSPSIFPFHSFISAQAQSTVYDVSLPLAVINLIKYHTDSNCSYKDCERDRQ